MRGSIYLGECVVAGVRVFLYVCMVLRAFVRMYTCMSVHVQVHVSQCANRLCLRKCRHNAFICASARTRERETGGREGGGRGDSWKRHKYSPKLHKEGGRCNQRVIFQRTLYNDVAEDLRVSPRRITLFLCLDLFLYLFDAGAVISHPWRCRCRVF